MSANSVTTATATEVAAAVHML